MRRKKNEKGKNIQQLWVFRRSDRRQKVVGEWRRRRRNQLMSEMNKGWIEEEEWCCSSSSSLINVPASLSFIHPLDHRVDPHSHLCIFLSSIFVFFSFLLKSRLSSFPPFLSPSCIILHSFAVLSFLMIGFFVLFWLICSSFSHHFTHISFTCIHSWTCIHSCFYFEFPLILI